MNFIRGDRSERFTVLNFRAIFEISVAGKKVSKNLLKFLCALLINITFCAIGTKQLKGLIYPRTSLRKTTLRAINKNGL